MVGGGQRLALLPGPRPRVRERVHAVGPCEGGRLELQAVLADVAEAVDADDRSRDVARSTGDARDEGVPRCEPFELGAGLGRHGRVLGTRHDRREDAVDVEEERRSAGLDGDEFERIHPA